MKKYIYDNATVYITKPTEEQIQNIHIATERFAMKLLKKGLIGNDVRRHNRGVSIGNINAGRRVKQTKSKARKN